MKWEDLKASVGFMLALIAALLMCCGSLLTSCRTPYVPVEKIKTEYQYIDRLQYDSIYLKDSVRYYMKGDTVFIDKYKYLYKYVYIDKVDSFVKTDSIDRPYPVERKLSGWESAKMELGGWAFGSLLLSIIVISWIVYKKRLLF